MSQDQISITLFAFCCISFLLEWALFFRLRRLSSKEFVYWMHYIYIISFLAASFVNVRFQFSEHALFSSSWGVATFIFLATALRIFFKNAFLQSQPR
jgi:hypothetical protein